MGRRCQCGQRADDVLRWEYVGAGVHRINQAHGPAQQIVPGKFRRAQILAAGVQQKNRGGHGDGDTQELTISSEGILVVQQAVQMNAHDEQVPAHIENQKTFPEGDDIVQSAVHDMVAPGWVI